MQIWRYLFSGLVIGPILITFILSLMDGAIMHANGSVGFLVLFISGLLCAAALYIADSRYSRR
jgi:hypothetical protein